MAMKRRSDKDFPDQESENLYPYFMVNISTGSETTFYFRYQIEVFTKLFNEGLASGGSFVVIDKKTGEIIGSTRFSRVSETDNAIEIGWSYLARAYWGGVYNQSQKRLLMDYAFQYVGHVFFYINKFNMRSRKAVEKLGGHRISHFNNQLLDARSEVGVIYRIGKVA